MQDERDMAAEKKWQYEQLARKCIKSLELNNFGARFAIDRGEALSLVLGMVPPEATVGFGDSVTLAQVGVTEEIDSRWQERAAIPHKGVMPLRERIAIMKRAASADVFLTGANALTLDGKIVSVDGLGNRLAGLLFGPKKVIVVCGANKIVPDVNSALQRIKTFAAPLNARRHYLKHGAEQLPCAATGQCVDCRHQYRICNFTLIADFQQKPPAGREPRITVVIVAEELGI